MVSNNTPLAGLVGIVLVIAIVGAVSGLALSGTDLLNFHTSAAVARAQDQETKLQAQKAIIDLNLYRAENAAEIEKVTSDLEKHKAIQAAQLQAEKDKVDLEVEAWRRELDQDLVLARLTRLVVLAAATVVTLIVSVGLAAFLIQYGRSRLVLARAEATHAATWHVPAWRAEQVRRAREREIAERQAAGEPAIGGNGRHAPKGESIRTAGQQMALGSCMSTLDNLVTSPG